MTSRIDRITGALVGLAAGDALGAPYEFGPPVDHVEPMIGGGPFRWAPGEWTDDTQMAICIAEVAATGSLDPVAVADRFLDWESQAKDIGNQTRAVLTAASSAESVAAAARAYFERNPRRSAGNGSLMRTAPVALAHLGDPERIAEAARTISDLTHGDPQAGDACVLWCVGIDWAIAHGELPDLTAGIAHLPEERRFTWAEVILRAETEPPRTFTPNGYVVTAFQAAWSSIVSTFGQPDHLEAALRTAVGIGGDTDTVAAIAGSMLGAAYGASAVPADWRAALNGWPGYTAADLARLAVFTANGGESDPELDAYLEEIAP